MRIPHVIRTAGLASLAVVLATACASPSYLAPDRPGADQLVDMAVQEAAATDRTVMVRFRASWCEWCARLDEAVHSFELGRMLGDYYVQVELTVDEDPEKIQFETPQAGAYRESWGGEDAGIPFYVFLDATGQVIADSLAMPGGGNIGYPVTEDEIARFMELVERTAPRMSEDERAMVRSYIEDRAVEIL